MTPPTMETRALACELAIDTRALDTRADGDVRVPVAISSEAPVLRYDFANGKRYYEVLDHSAAAVNMAWAQRGVPLLLSHDSRDQYGLVTDLTISDDRKLRGWIKFSRGQKAQEIRQDIEDGIRPMVSVGYSTGEDYTEDGRAADGIEVRRYTNWTVFEVSTVPIPADPSVGIGRSHPASDIHTPAATMAGSEHMETTTVPTAPAAPAPVALPETTAGETRSREATIFAFAASAGLNARDAQALVASGRDAESIGKELLERMNKEANHFAAPTPAVELTEREQSQYSLMRALNGIAAGRRSGFEFEVSDEFARQTGRSYTNDNSFFLPLNLRTQLSVGTSNKGPELRGTEQRPELIELLRQRSLAIGTLGARFMPGLVGNVAFPRQTAGVTATWVAEAPGSDMSLSSLSLDQVTLSPKTLQASTTVSRQLLAQSTPAADQIVFDDLIAQHAVAIDAAVLYGTGASNQPTGVGVASGTNLIAMGTNGAQASLAKILEGLKEIEIDNAMTDNVSFVTTPGIKFSMKAIPRIASTDSITLWDRNNTVEGLPAYSTNNLPSTLTKGSASGTAHAAVIGDFSQVMVGEWGAGAEIIVDPYTLARRNLIQITSIQFADVQVRIPSAFAVYRDLLV
jgi:HK97 family phage major capsid protein